MKDKEKYLAAFEKAMDADGIFKDMSLTFGDICALVGAERRSLDSMLMEELGYSGEEIVAVYRRQMI